MRGEESGVSESEGEFMPRRKGRQSNPPSTRRNNKRKLMMGVGLLISLLASAILAQRAHLWHALKPTSSPTPTGLTASTPSKEYIYAGSRLVATEEPASQGGGCTYGISPTSGSHGAGSGIGSVSVTAGTGCAWTASSNAGWITITSGSSGSGNGMVSYSVTANTGAARNSSITAAGQTFTITQSAAGGPPAPTSLTATALTSTSIRLNWSFVEDGISIFYIERKTGTTGTYAQVATGSNGDRNFTNTKLAAHTTYCYRIRAYNGQYGAYSNEACATTP
jgi:hypothetical protein